MKKIIQIKNYYNRITGYLDYEKEVGHLYGILKSLRKSDEEPTSKEVERFYIGMRSGSGVNCYEIVSLPESEVEEMLEDYGA